MADIFMQFSSS